MNKLQTPLMKVIVFILMLSSMLTIPLTANVSVIPTDETQDDFKKAYYWMTYRSYVDYRFTSSSIDTLMFPAWGEYTIYWAKTGTNKGSFVYPDNLPSSYSNVTRTNVDDYDWDAAEHWAIQYKRNSRNVAIFKSVIESNNRSVSWEAIHFKNMFKTYLWDNIYYYIDETDLSSSNINSNTQLLIIPSFSMNGTDNKYYIDSIFTKYPSITERLNNFLARGGTIYAEGNAVYFIEKLGYLSQNAVDFDNSLTGNTSTNLIDISFNDSDNPLSFLSGAVNNKLYGSEIPKVNASDYEVIASAGQGSHPAVFIKTGTNANGGRIVCNVGLPTVGGLAEAENGSRQIQWALNTFLFAYCQNVDITRSLYNELPDSVTAGRNAISYDRIDTFEVRIKVRNLSDEEVTDIEIREYIRGFFEFVDMQSVGVGYEINGNTLKITDFDIDALSEEVITYRLRTPDTDSDLHADIDDYISWNTYIYASYNSTTYTDSMGDNVIKNYRNYTDIMFSAEIVADTDLNWKNFLYLDYQPFKVFMIMENKERTAAKETKYTQYIPKDVPFYWTDHEINIPILKTPGGKYVDVLRGSNDQNDPEYDMDSDGYPDVWLDTASIYPKNYTIEEDEVYWLNPWEHMRTGDSLYYEDIDHDGKRAKDLDGDGIVDVEEPGDKIRVWKVTWEIGDVSGYEYYDPYCSYEIWVDPPDLVKLSAGVGYAHGLLDEQVNGMFYPYAANINNADLTDTTWSYWMERKDNGDIYWKQFIKQSIRNYEGFTFIDTLAENYTLKPTDHCVGTVPQPHREFIAVLSLGGEEIDMEKWIPNNSRYSNIEYETIFNEERVTPIRTTYTYYAPLPNPLQFEYLTNCYSIADTNGNELRNLPEWGPAEITFDIDASTEYSYYWIRNVGHDVDYNDPSADIEGVEELGDGVFGYMVYEIPKGIGGYEITLPKKADGSYDVNQIVQVKGDDGNYHDFEKWLDNENTGDSLEIWENQYTYQVFIPQLLIPPALDDDNNDGVDDWIDDRGDRFCSSTGFLHDRFMLDDGEDWLNYPAVPFIDDIYGRVDSGWYGGNDNTYGDDFFENLGKTHFRIKANYEGKGKEGPIEISKGGWLVVEEIFGGSPWVIFSHALSGYAEGVDYIIESKTQPSMVKYGTDSTFIRHKIYDKNEPHDFDMSFDPFHLSYGYGETTITTYAGGKDPCNLVSPPVTFSTIIDPDYQQQTLTLVPYADPDNPDLAGYPKQETGVFLEVRVELMNGTDDNFVNTTIKPVISDELGNTELIMNYISYPRPLVPAKFDPQSGTIIQGGDQIGAFSAGWRFNQPEGEVLVKMGDTLNMIQPSRRAYFIYLFKIDPNLDNGVYSIDFTINGQKLNYNGTNNGRMDYEVPSVMFSIADRNSSGSVQEYEKIILGQGSLNNLISRSTEYMQPLENVRWSLQAIDYDDFDDLESSLSATVNSNGDEIIDMTQFENFPQIGMEEIFVLEQIEVNSLNAPEDVQVTHFEKLEYDYEELKDQAVTYKKLYVSSIGPKLNAFKRIYSVNGELMPEDGLINWPQTSDELEIVALVEVVNFGNDLAKNTNLKIYLGSSFLTVEDSLPQFCSWQKGYINADLGYVVPGESKQIFIHFKGNIDVCETIYLDVTTISKIELTYDGNQVEETFSYSDLNSLEFPAKDFELNSLEADVEVATWGDKIGLTANYANGSVDVSGLPIEVYAVKNFTDTTLIGQTTLDLQSMATGKYSVEYTIPSDCYYVEFFASLDSDSEHSEFCETNNSKVLVLPLDLPLAVKLRDNTTCPDSCITLDPEVEDWPVQFTYSWTPSNHFDDASKEAPQFCTSTPGIYTVSVNISGERNYFHGQAEIEVTVRPNPIVEIPQTHFDFQQLQPCVEGKEVFVHITNHGEEEFVIDSISVPEGYTVSDISLPYTMMSGDERDFKLTFSPDEPGQYNSSLIIHGNPCACNKEITLVGEKLEFDYAISSNFIDYGEELICGEYTADSTIIISNNGTSEIDLLLSEVMIDEPYTITQPISDVSIQPGETQELTLRYSPSKRGNYEHNLRIPIESGECSDDIEINLSGKMLAPEVGFIDDRVIFAPITDCESTIDTTVKIMNNGDVDLEITSFGDVDIFAINLPIVLQPGEATDLYIEYTPHNIGAFSQPLVLYSEPCGKIDTLMVEGRVDRIDFDIPDTINVGRLDVCLDESVSSPFTIYNASDGQHEGIINNIIIEGPFETNLSIGTKLNKDNPEYFDLNFIPSSNDENGLYSGKMTLELGPCNITKEVILLGEKSNGLKITAETGEINMGDRLICEGMDNDSSINIVNTGELPADINISEITYDGPFELISPIENVTLQPEEDIDLSFAVNSSERGLIEGKMYIAYSSGNCSKQIEVDLKVNMQNSEISSDLSEIQFPSILGCETSKDTTITITNTGDVQTEIVSIAPNIILSPDLPIIIEAGKSTDVSLTLQPDEIGEIDEMLEITYLPCNKTESIHITGSKDGVAFAIDDTLFAGDLLYCNEETISNTFTIANNSDGDVVGKISSFEISGPFTTNIENDHELLNGIDTEFEIQFNANDNLDAGWHYGELILNLEPCTQQKTIILKARKLIAEISSSDDIDFGRCEFGDSEEETIIIDNTGNTSLTISEIGELSSQFKVVNMSSDIPTELLPDETLEITVAYEPNKAGEIIDTLRIISLEPCSDISQEVKLTGNCRMPLEVILPESIDICRDSSDVLIPEIEEIPYSLEYIWQPSTGLSDNRIAEPTITLDEPGQYEYILTVTGKDGYYKGVDTVIINILDDAEISANITSMDFGELDACMSSKSMPIEITNDSDYDITIYEADASSGFEAVSSELPKRLEAGEKIEITVVYSPESTGEHTGNLKISGMPCGAEINIPLEGMKHEMLLNSQPPSIVFEPQNECDIEEQTKSITLKNNGTDDIRLDFNKYQIDAPFSVDRLGYTIIEPGGEEEVEIVYLPDVSGSYDGKLTIPFVSGSCDSEISINLGGFVRNVEIASVPTYIVFPPLLGCDYSADTTITIENIGESDILINDYMPKDIVDISLPIEIEAGESKEVNITFSPDQSGTFTEDIIFTYSPCDYDYSIDLIGIKQGVIFQMPDSINFGSVLYCNEQTSQMKFNLANLSDGLIDGKIKSLRVYGPFETNLSNGTIIENGRNLEFDATFIPHETDPNGKYKGRIELELEPCDIVRNIYLSGRKDNASLLLYAEDSPSIVDFGLNDAEQNVEKTVYIENTGSVMIDLEDISEVNEPFELVSISPVPPLVLNVGEKATAVVSFKSSEPGEYSQMFTAYSNTPCTLNNAEILLSGSSKALAVMNINIPDKTAQVGDKVIIPLILESSENLRQSGITHLNAKIYLNKTILKPTGSTPNGTIIGDIRVLELENIPVDKESGTLANLEFVALLGETDCTALEVELEWVGGSSNNIIHHGRFCISDICEQGGKRLVTMDNKIYLYEPVPNPASDKVSIEYEIIEKARTKLYLVNVMGQKVTVIFDSELEAGHYTIDYDISDLPSGIYMLTLETPSHLKNRIMGIVK